MTLFTIEHKHYFMPCEQSAEVLSQLSEILKQTIINNNQNSQIMNDLAEVKALVKTLEAQVETLQTAINDDQASDAQVVADLKDQNVALQALLDAANANAVDPAAVQEIIDGGNAIIAKIEAAKIDVAGPNE